MQTHAPCTRLAPPSPPPRSPPSASRPSPSRPSSRRRPRPAHPCRWPSTRTACSRPVEAGGGTCGTQRLAHDGGRGELPCAAGAWRAHEARCVQPCWPHGGPGGEHVSTAPQAGHESSSSSSLQVGAAGGVVIAARSSPLLLVANVGPLIIAQGYSREAKREAPLCFSPEWLTSTSHERSYPARLHDPLQREQ